MPCLVVSLLCASYPFSTFAYAQDLNNPQKPKPGELLLECIKSGKLSCDVPTPNQPGGTIWIPKEPGEGGMVMERGQNWNFDSQLKELNAKGIFIPDNGV